MKRTIFSMWPTVMRASMASRLTRGSALRDGETPLFIVLLLPQLEVVSQYWRLLDKPLWWSSRRVTGQEGHFCVTLSLDEGTPCIVHWPCHALPMAQASLLWAFSKLWNTSLCLHKAVLCWQSALLQLPVKCSKSIVFPIISVSIRRADSWGLGTPQVWDVKAGEQKDFFFSSPFVALIASAGEKNERRHFHSYLVKSTDKLISTGLERTSREWLAYSSSATGLSIPNMSTMAARQTCS